MTSRKPKPRANVSSHLKQSAINAMSNRAERRALRVSNKESASADSSSDVVVEKIRGLMIEAGVPFLPLERSLNFAKPQAKSGVQHGLVLLAHNPAAMKVDLTVPWAGVSLGEGPVRNLLKGLHVPSWANRLKKIALSNISKPNVIGMLNVDGTPNKDLKQLLKVDRSGKSLSSDILAFAVEARQELVSHILDILSEIEDPLFSVVINSRGEKRCRLNKWTLETVQQQMAKAIKSSSPGYPYNGCDWQENIEGYTCLEHAFIACESLVSDDEPAPGFIFFQQSRATGDGGDGEKSDGGGRQRLVMAAPANEKVLGHILAYPFKLYAKHNVLSGQNGIQAVSRSFKSECQQIIAEEDDLSQWYIGDSDVSDWDAAQIKKRMKFGYFSVAEMVLDDEDEFTRRVLAKYDSAYVDSILVTACGQIECEFLPSGSSITTVSAFVNHEIILRVVNKVVTKQRGYPLLHKWGIQGDDNIAIFRCPDESAIEALSKVYEEFGCSLKNGVHLSCLSEDDASAIFLNEAIRVRDEVNVYSNAKFPRWNLFWAENFRDAFRGPNIDRMLYEEVLRNCPHPTEKELTHVSFVSKLDRFVEMPFYEKLVKWFLKRSTYPIRSWLGERVIPKSQTSAFIQTLEVTDGINWPEPHKRGLDRREEFWATSDELAMMFTTLGLLSPTCVEARVATNTIVDKAKNTQAWKRARSAMELAKVDFSTEKDTVTVEGGADIISLAFEMYYSKDKVSSENEIVQAVADPEDDEFTEELALDSRVTKIPNFRTLMRGILALNENDPYQLRQYFAQAVIGAVDSPTWRSLSDDQRSFIETGFREMYGANVDGTVDIDWLSS